MVRHSLEAVEQTGIDAEVIDRRWLDAASLDWDTIGESIRKTNAVLIVERVTGGEASPSISRVLERAAIARTEEVVAGLERVRRGMGER